MSEIKVDSVVNAGGDNDSGIDLSTNDVIKFDIAGAEKARVDSSGNLFVGKTSSSFSSTGTELGANGQVTFTSDGNTTVQINRKSSNGEILRLSKDGTSMLELGNDGNDGMIQSDGDRVGFTFGSENMVPRKNGAISDNTVDLGHPSYRFDDLYATNGTIQTSDQNEKNTITDSDLGLDFVNRLAPKSYIFNGKTRTHYGLIAQDVETVLSDINKETSEFAGFIKDDISEEQDGSQFRYGLRYTEFIGILIKALQEADDKIDALTARVTALESE